MNRLALTERASHLLKTLVEIYIREGRPVGSKTLSSEKGVTLSSATIRKIMSQLEFSGYLSSPHTSAGRVPTSKAYRLFVDGLVAMHSLETHRRAQIEASIKGVGGLSALAESASELLANMTQMASLVMVPGRVKSILRQIEFLPLPQRRILVILVVNEKEVQNRVITADQTYDDAELKVVANYINVHFSGGPLEVIGPHIKLSLECDDVESYRTLQAAQELMSKAIAEQEEATTDCIVAGQNYLLDEDPETDLGKLKSVLDTFARKYETIQLMKYCAGASGVNIFIGDEVGSNIVAGYSLVSAPYKVDGSLLGVLAVLGPTRMPYQKIIPTVDITAKILSSTLNQSN